MRGWFEERSRKGTGRRKVERKQQGALEASNSSSHTANWWALCFSTAEYACSSGGRSRHTGHVDITLNDTYRVITGYLKATPNTMLVCTGGDSPSPHTPKGCRQRRSLPPRSWPETPTPWPTPCQAQASIQKQLSWLNRSTLKTRCSYYIVGRGVERLWWTISWVAWQRDHPKWTFGQRHRRALVHLEEFESAESAERTLSGYDENVEALPSYDMWWCPQLHVDIPGFSNPCRC